MPQLNPFPWFSTMMATWVTLVFLVIKLTSMPTYTTPKKMDKPALPKAHWPW